MSFSLPVGHIAGILVRIHWTLLVLWLFDLNSYMKVFEGRAAVPALAIHAAALFGSILLHELGHAFAARRVGGRADEILLWPLGGSPSATAPELAREPHRRRQGALVTVIIVGASALLFRFIDPGTNPYLHVAETVLVRWNIFILVFNLIPLYPMDGGRIFHALAWAWFGRHGAASAQRPCEGEPPHDPGFLGDRRRRSRLRAPQRPAPDRRPPGPHGPGDRVAPAGRLSGF